MHFAACQQVSKQQSFEVEKEPPIGSWSVIDRQASGEDLAIYTDLSSNWRCEQETKPSHKDKTS